MRSDRVKYMKRVTGEGFALSNQSSGINVQPALLFTDRKTSQLSLEHGPRSWERVHCCLGCLLVLNSITLFTILIIFACAATCASLHVGVSIATAPLWLLKWWDMRELLADVSDSDFRKYSHHLTFSTANTVLENMEIGSVVLDFPQHNTFYSGQKKWIALPHFSVLLKCLVANRMHVLEYFHSVI